MPTQAKQGFSATKSVLCTAPTSSITTDDASSVAKSACTYPRTSCRQSANGISGTVSRYIALNSATIATMTSWCVTKGNTVAWCITTDWHKTLPSEAP